MPKIAQDLKSIICPTKNMKTAVWGTQQAEANYGSIKTLGSGKQETNGEKRSPNSDFLTPTLFHILNALSVCERSRRRLWAQGQPCPARDRGWSALLDCYAHMQSCFGLDLPHTALGHGSWRGQGAPSTTLF